LWGPESTGAVPDGRRERKKSRTRQDLVEAATKLFAAQGFSNTTIEQITELADVSTRTFFRHFASKEEVLFPQRYHTDALLSAVADQPEASSDLRAIRDAFIGLLTFDEAGLQRALLFRKAVRSDPALEGRELAVRRQFHRYLALAVARRHSLDEPDEVAEMVAVLAQSVIALAFDQWADSDGQADLEKLLSRKFDLADRIVSAEGSAEHPAGPRSEALRRGGARARRGAGPVLIVRRLGRGGFLGEVAAERASGRKVGIPGVRPVEPAGRRERAAVGMQ
jgi:AcrR family transcriptional regulator